jgi:hypothetical protein
MLNPSLRPTRYEPDIGHLYVTLTDEDRALAYRCGDARYRSQRNGGNHDPAFRPGEGARNDIEGVLAEIAFSLMCGVVPNELVMSIPEWERRRGVDGGQLTDVFDVEIRATIYKNGRLPIHKNTSRDGAAKQNNPFVLGVVDSSHFYTGQKGHWTKFTTGDPALDALIASDKLKFYDPEVRFSGWCYGHEVKESHWVAHWSRPEYGVPQEDLHKMAELAPTRFLLASPSV